MCSRQILRSLSFHVTSIFNYNLSVLFFIEKQVNATGYSRDCVLDPFGIWLFIVNTISISCIIDKSSQSPKKFKTFLDHHVNRVSTQRVDDLRRWDRCYRRPNRVATWSRRVCRRWPPVPGCSTIWRVWRRRICERTSDTAVTRRRQTLSFRHCKQSKRINNVTAGVTVWWAVVAVATDGREAGHSVTDPSAGVTTRNGWGGETRVRRPRGSRRTTGEQDDPSRGLRASGTRRRVRRALRRRDNAVLSTILTVRGQRFGTKRPANGRRRWRTGAPNGRSVRTYVRD